ncbi:dimethyl sulfoxide reductase anchor subunit family protein [Primorskyibacter sp. S187A]|uniref:dimethyl sulfoxide reductase anchor subunit family protein n=1 Tax=Primorskyibacter sp. S187A TaxID=3415130 RepID=UPI003C7C83BF
MHPAPSIIAFTTLSGLGFGLLFWLGLGMPGSTGGVAFVFWAIAYALSVGGLISSTLHLGHPERAIKALSQWRSSWLSREGIAAVATLVVMGLYGLGRVFFDASWQPLGYLGAALSLVTVYTTSMIYGQLKSVPRWNQSVTPALFLTFSLGGGALLAGQVTIAVALLALAAVVQVIWWVKGDGRFAEAGSTLASATGLGNMGAVRAFEPPHTGTNYLLKEMVHVVGRAHAQKLRIIAFALGFAVPIVLLLLPFSHWVGLLAVASHIAGIMASRWLFFAEAEHVVGLYYGKR